MRSIYINIILFSFSFSFNLITGCKKLTEISPPVGKIVATQVFSTDDQAISAASGMYFKMINTNRSFSSSAMSVFCGMSADELISFDQNYTDLYLQFQKNSLVSTNGLVGTNFWGNAYSTVYEANAIIEGLKNASGVHDSVKNELTGEAEFVRAFCNFYLINLFGDIPLVTTINYQKTSILSRAPTSEIYQAILNDLKDAQNRLSSDYSVGRGQRIVPNKWAATALLARVYLYMGNWPDAKAQADSVINNSSLYSLVKNLKDVFLANSTEAIWQLQQSNSIVPFYNVTPEGYLLIPKTLNSNTYSPFAYLTNQLFNSFEADDQRKTIWVDSTLYRGVKYYFPYKYKSGPLQIITPNGPYSEYYMVLRLAEQYLIRAEAEAQLQEDNAVTDLNVIRNRAGLPIYTGATDQNSVLSAIYHERQVELFAEWGHRWLDLKRIGQATTVLSIKKGFTLNSNMLLYPIPVSELATDPNLIQNPSY